MDQKHRGVLPGTAWLGRLSLAWKLVLAMGLASLPLGAVAFSAAAGVALSASMAAIFGLLSLLSWYLLAALYGSLTSLFREMRDAHVLLEGGDFGVRLVPRGKDESARLAGSFNDAAREVGRVVAEIRDAAAEVAHAAVELKKGADVVADAALRQETAAAETAAAVEEMTVSIAEVASQSRDAEHTSHAVSELSAAGSRAIAQSSGEIQSLARAVGEVSQLMNQLAQRAAEVTQITGLITQVSDQTNLLALNAAIEAARAGEHGRGFAVVADEVRMLAQRARRSADEITRTVATIQSEIEQAVVHMGAASDQARESVAHASGATGALAQIDAQALIALDSVHQIAAGTQQQSANSADIARHVEHIAASAQGNSQAATETAGMAAHLARLADGMRGALSGFRA